VQFIPFLIFVVALFFSLSCIFGTTLFWNKFREVISRTVFIGLLMEEVGELWIRIFYFLLGIFTFYVMTKLFFDFIMSIMIKCKEC